MQSNQIDKREVCGGVITHVQKGSIAASLGLKKGDILTMVNGVELKDILDYRYQIAEEFIEICIQRGDKELEFEVEKEYDSDLGLEFEDVLFDQIRRCQNNCDFCFIYQLPKKMRRSLYIKDDDYRLSFLYGNYVTLAGLKKSDYDKILEYHLSPLYVSVHATDLKARRELLKNEKAEDILEKLSFLIEQGIEIYTQAVIVPGLNDGTILDQTMSDLLKLYPGVLALGVVPVGLTQYQSRLKRLSPHTKEEAKECIQRVENFQKACLKTHKTPFVQVADEFYLKAGTDFPKAKFYAGYPLEENGVGSCRMFLDSFFSIYKQEMKLKEKSGIITGSDGKILFENHILPKVAKEHRENIQIFGIENFQFGPSVTVSGLLAGKDIMNQIPKTHGCARFFLPGNCLKFDQEILIDDVSVSEISSYLQAKVEVVETVGETLVQSIFQV